MTTANLPTESAQALQPFLAGFETRPAHADSVRELQERARARFEATGFPSKKEEDWRLTDLRRVTKGNFRADDRPLDQLGVSAEQLEPLLYEGCRNVVVLNGRVVTALSDLDTSDVAGLRVAPMAEALVSDELGSRLGELAPFEDHAFVALNTAMFADGVFLEVDPGAVIEQPLHLLFLSQSAGVPTASYPRNLFVLGENSQSTIIETYVSLDDRESLTCPVTEIHAGQASVCHHYKVQKESLSANHLSAFQVRLERDTNFSTQAITHGGALVRNDVAAQLDGQGAVCTLNGLYVVGDDQQVSNHMWVEHKKPNTYSHELFKGILDGTAETVFNGRIYVHKAAQKTDAKQSNRNLLLSDRAIAHSNPQLEIFADDVRCTHGSTTGHLEEEAVFYLRSRGIEKDAATSLLTYAFASEFVELVTVEALRLDLQDFLFSRLAGGEIVRQAV